MELFNITKNRYFLAVQILINRIYSKEITTVDQFDEQLSTLLGEFNKASRKFCDNVLKNNDENNDENNHIDIFDFSDKQQVKLMINSAVPLLPCAAEKVWLDMVLSDPHCSLFFDEERRKDFRDNLDIESMGDVRMSIKRERVWGDEINDELGEKLKIILKAIHEKRKIIYSNHTKNGDHIHKKATPYKVEYAIAEDKLRVSMWSDEERPIKANLSNLFDISIAEKTDNIRSIKEMVSSRLLDEPLVFIVTNENNALERAIHTFSKHRRNVIALDDKRYQFEISYYTFEENSLISDIMSFGPMIEVVSPKRVREEVINKLVNYSVLSGKKFLSDFTTPLNRN